MNWISIDIGLPEVDEEVLIYEYSNFKLLACYYLAKINEEGEWQDTLNDEILENVRFWMRIKEPYC